MKLFSTVGEYFALDIGTTAIRVIELSGGPGAWSLSRYCSVPVDIKVSSSDAGHDQQKLGEVIMTAVGQAGIRARNVIVGIPSDKLFTTVIDLPDMSLAEMATTVRYQAEQYVPMNINEAQIDWALLGTSVNDPTKKEVLLTSVQKTFSESRLDLVEGLGFNVIAMEPDPLALTRSLLPSNQNDAKVIVEVGDFATDIVVAHQDSPRLMRSISTGFQSLVKAASQNLNVEISQAQQFLQKFGLQQDKLEGQVYRATQGSVEQITLEIEKSVKFFKTRYPSVEVRSMIVSNYGVTMPGMSNFLAQKTDLAVVQGSPWQQVRVSNSDQTKLQSLSTQFAVVVGLAQGGAVL